MHPDEHVRPKKTAESNMIQILAFLKKYPDSEIYDSLGRSHFFSRETGMICAVDDITAGLVWLKAGKRPKTEEVT